MTTAVDTVVPVVPVARGQVRAFLPASFAGVTFRVLAELTRGVWQVRILPGATEAMTLPGIWIERHTLVVEP